MKRACAIRLCALATLAAAGPANALVFQLTGTITSCTPSCDSLAFLGTGSTISGFIEVSELWLRDGTWAGEDVRDVAFTIGDPALPPFGPSDPPDPVVDNPFTLDPGEDGGRLVVARGQTINNPRGSWPPCDPQSLGPGCVIDSAGTYDGTTLDSGILDVWVTEGLLGANGIVVRLDFAAGTFVINLFENAVVMAGGDFNLVQEEPHDILIQGFGLDARRGRCRNLDTGFVVNPPGALGLVVPCEAYGFVAAPGDRVALTILGTAFTVEQLGSLTYGVDVDAGVCVNHTTGERVETVATRGAVECVTAGLVAAPGDLVSITAVGAAQ